MKIQKVYSVSADLISSGRFFQSLWALTAKDLSPFIFSQVSWTDNRLMPKYILVCMAHKGLKCSPRGKATKSTKGKYIRLCITICMRHCVFCYSLMLVLIGQRLNKTFFICWPSIFFLAKGFSLWLKWVFSQHVGTDNDWKKGEKGDWAVTDAQIRTIISHAKSPGTGPWTLDVSLTLGRPQTKEEKSTNQWAFSPTRGGEREGGAG